MLDCFRVGPVADVAVTLLVSTPPRARDSPFFDHRVRVHHSTPRAWSGVKNLTSVDDQAAR